ncbi:MAG: glycosyltransferase [Candidatus Sumerlaeota bacterium]|nr:glycosyltransferase [Candidatus Sumerlaeota bacterium]
MTRTSDSSENPPAKPARVAYIASQYPTLRETFVIREILELERRGVEVTAYSLKRPMVGLRHDDLRGARAPVYYSPHCLCGGLILDNLRTLAESPRRYVGFAVKQAWTFRRHPGQALKALLLFPKMVHYARRMKRLGIERAVACWANFPTTTALAARRLFGIRYCMTCHAWDIFVAKNQAGLEDKIAEANLVRTISDFNVKYLRPFCRSEEDRKKIVRNYIGVDVSRLPVRTEEPGGRFTLAAGGSLIEQKGLRHLLDAMAILKESGVSPALTIIGEGELRRPLEDQTRRLGLADCVKLVGTMSNQAVLDLIRQSSAFVLPCVQVADGMMDGIPTILIEAMAVGVPVISCFVSGVPELIENGVSGLLTPPGDSPALASAIRRLMEDAGLREGLAKEGRAKVEREFDIRRNVELLVDLYREWGIL